MRRFAVVTAAFLTLAAAAAPAFAKGTKTRERLRIVGNSVSADWSYTEGNIGTFVNVVVTENDESGTAGKTETAFVSLSISRYEVDTGNVLITGVAIADGSSTFGFNIDRQLNSATVDATNMIFQDDNSFTFFTVDLHLTWTATSEATTSESKSNEHTPGMKFKSRFKGLFRDGITTGSVVGTNIPTGTQPTIQFTPVPSNNAQLQFNKFGSMTITTQTL
jgi:hypothetical protein